MTTPQVSPDVVVVGGGLIGLSCAWRMARAGLRVTVCDPTPGERTSIVAAGMLAPVTEVEFGEEDLLALNLASAEAWPGFAAELEHDSGLPAGLYPSGTLAVAYDRDDTAVLDRLATYQRKLGLDVEQLTGRETRRREPMLANGVAAGLWVPGDHSADNRKTVTALLAAVRNLGVELRVRRTARLLATGGRVTGVELDDGTTLTAPAVVVATGPWSGDTAGIPAELVPPVRPVKGEVLRLRVPEAYRPVLSHTVRATARGFSVYLVPRPDGELVIGATSSELGFDTRVLAGGVYALLRDARTVLPVIDELELVESIAGLRPATPDNAPVLGPSELDGLFWATGHYRNGVLLTPVTAAIIVEAVATGSVPPLAKAFGPERFIGREVAT